MYTIDWEIFAVKNFSPVALAVKKINAQKFLTHVFNFCHLATRQKLNTQIYLTRKFSDLWYNVYVIIFLLPFLFFSPSFSCPTYPFSPLTLICIYSSFHFSFHPPSLAFSLLCYFTLSLVLSLFLLHPSVLLLSITIFQFLPLTISLLPSPFTPLLPPFPPLFSVTLSNQTSGHQYLHQWLRPHFWFVIYADNFTCDGTPPLENEVIQYEMVFFNPDSSGQATDHFGDDYRGIVQNFQCMSTSFKK